MTPRIVSAFVLLAVVGLLGAGAWFVLDSGAANDTAALGRPEGAGGGAVGSSATEGAGAKDDVEALRRGSAAPPPPVPAAPGSAAITGRVVDAQGQGVLAEVMLSHEGREEPAELALSVDEDGGFEGTGLLALPGAKLSVQAEGFGNLRRNLDLVPDRTLDLGNLVLEAEAVVRGRVESTEGGVVPGASIRDRQQVFGVADEEGRFALTGLPAAELWLYAEAEGYAALSSPPLRVRPGRVVEDLVLQVDPACFVEGVILEQGGRPVAGAPVSARLVESPSDPDLVRRPWAQGPAAPETRSAEDGAFRVGPLPQGQCSLDVRAVGYDREQRQLDTDTQGVQILLETRAVVFGRVVDGEGDPVALSRVQMLQGRSEQNDWSPSWMVGMEDSRLPEGHFELSARTGRPLRVLAEGPGIARTVSEPFQLEHNEPYGPVILQAATGWIHRGIVVDDQGRPLPGAEVRIEERAGGSALNLRRDLQLRSVETDAEGRFSTPPLTEGLHRVRAQREGTFPREALEWSVGASDPDEELRIVLDRGGWIAGDLRPELLGVQQSLLVMARAELEPGQETEQSFAVANLNSGRYRVGPLRPGAWTVLLLDRTQLKSQGSWGMARFGVQQRNAAAPGLNGEPLHPWIEHAGVPVVAGEETWLGLELEAERHTVLRGRLFWDGRALPFGRVQLKSAGKDLECTTDRDGWFEFDGAIEGEVILAAADRPGRAHVGHRVLSVVLGSELEEDLRVDTGVIRGTVVDASSEAGLAGVMVFVAIEPDLPGNPRNVQWDRFQTGADGSFEFVGVPSGAIEVRASLRGHVAPAPSPWRLSPGAELRVGELSLAAGGNLTVRHSDAESFDVVVSREDTGERRTGSSRRGRVYLGTMRAGKWRVELSVDGRPVAEGEAEVEAGKTADLLLD